MSRPVRNLTLSEDDVGMWLDRIKEGEKWVKELRQKTAAYRKAYHGEFPKPMPNEDDGEQVYVNRVHRVVLQWIGSMYMQEPRIHLDPPWTSPKVDRKTVALQESILNTEIRRSTAGSPIRRAAQSAFLDGWGWVKSGFHAEWDYEATEAEGLSTDAGAENHGFELGPDFFPKEVLVTEDHEEHIKQHGVARDETMTKLKLLVQKVQQQQIEAVKAAQQASMQAMSLGMASPPMQPPEVMPEITAEVKRLEEKAKAISDHMDLHEEKKVERDREGLFPTNARVIAENCWTDTVHNTNVVWDKHATGPHDWRWIAERLIRPLDEFKNNEKFKNTDRLEANFARSKPGTRGDFEDDTGGGAVKSDGYDETVGEEDEGDKLASVWKVWDIEHRRVLYLHDPMKDKALCVEEWPHKFLKTAPLRMLYFELREDEFSPVSPCTHFWPQQLELNRYRTKASIITRRISRLALADDRIPADQIAALQDAPDMSILPVKNVFNKSLKDLFQPVDWGQVPVDIYQNAGQAENDIQTDTGLGESMSGRIEAKTATAAQVNKSLVGVLMDLKLASLERLMVELAGDLRSLMRQYYQNDRYVELFWEGVKSMEHWNGTDLLDFEIRVEFGGNKREDQQMERMQWLQAAQFLSQVPGMNLKWIAERILATFDVKNAEEAFLDVTQQAPQMMQPGAGPGRGQNQTGMPGNMPETGAGAVGQPAQDMTKVGTS